MTCLLRLPVALNKLWGLCGLPPPPTFIERLASRSSHVLQEFETLNVSFARLRPSGLNRVRRNVPILLQKSLMASANGDSLALKRFAVETDDDGAAQS
jgi:hypothetical protein